MRQEEFFKANKRDIKSCKFFSDNKDFAINKENFPQVFFEIVGLFAEDCEDALTQVESLSGVLLIAGQSNDGKKKSRLYLNFTAENGEAFFMGRKINRRLLNETGGNRNPNPENMAQTKDGHDADIAFGVDSVNVTASQGGYVGPVTANFPAPRSAGLVIENVEFIHERRGYMSRLFEVLKRIQRNYNLGPIKMENVLSEKMISWCEKNNLEKVMAEKELNYYYYRR